MAERAGGIMYYRALYIAFVAVSCVGCGQVNAPSSAKTPVAFNAAGAPTVEFNLPDMMCEDGCALAVEDILERQPGATEVRVDFEGKTATVAIQEGSFDAEQALAALVDKGFDHSALKEGAAETQAAGGPDAKPQAAEVGLE
jgi:copper chaperone CopZ